MRCRKISKFVLTLLVIMLTGVIGYAEKEDISFSKEVTFLYDMGILNSYSPEAAVTKQLVQNNMEMLGVAYNSEKYFKTNDYKEPITFIEAAAVLADLTGRGAILTPNNVMSIASDAGIIKGINLSPNDYVNMECYAKMLYAALNADIMEASFTNGQTTYSVSYGKSYLSSCLHMQTYTGVITATSRTGLFLDSEKAEINHIKVDNEQFLINEDKNYDNYLGMSVVILYCDDNEEKELVSLYVPENKNQIVKIDSNDLVQDKSGVKSVCVQKDKIREYTISLDAAFIYNGVAAPYMNDSDMCINEGYIILINNDNDREFETVKVFSFESTVIKSSSETDLRIIGKNDVVYNLYDLNNDKKTIIIDENENEMLFSELKKGDTLSLGYEKNSDKIIFIQKGRKVSGKIEKIINEGIIFIDGTEYNMNYSFKTGKSGYKADNIRAGMGVAAYIDERNEIVGIEVTSDVDLYGYMTRLYMDESIGGNVKIKIFGSDGEFHEYELNDKLTFNSVRIKDKKQLLEKNQYVLWNGSQLRHQPIQYRVNSLGKVTKISTAVDNNKYSTYDENNFSLDYSGEIRYLTGDWQSLGGLYKLKSDTVIINVPYNLRDEDLFYTVEPEGWGQWTFNIELYDVDKEFNVGMAILRKPNYILQQASFKGNKPIIVKDILTTIDENDEIVYELTGWRNGAEYAIKTRVTDTFATFMPPEIMKAQGLSLPSEDDVKNTFSIVDLKPGSVIQPMLNNDRLTGFSLFYDGENPVYYEYSTYALPDSITEAECMFLSGRVHTLTEKGFLYTKNQPGEEVTVMRNISIGANTKIYLSENGRVFECSADELMMNDKVLLYYDYSTLHSIVIQR
ncbi:hypothetical protein [Ructibacterium gallinarum]|uniref:Uncharacterized protein n=1 Tax=Ructibacterium gallinarum TaxID=2779355 RepID=A0A9D5M0V2_9FIRM|nr:hypothetical protein [Ructibacterium gallinarum]MBE5040567.1 hypothetical protein [Ructibacterium gallinarum]